MAKKGRKIVVTVMKGGTGKTNFALNLSVYLAREGRQVVYLDLDRQKDGFDFFRDRAKRYPDAPAITHLALLDPDQVESAMHSASQAGADVVVDCPPLDPPQVERAQQVGDVLVFPFKPGGADLRAFSRALALNQTRIEMAQAAGQSTEKPMMFAIINEFMKGQLNDKMLLKWVQDSGVFQLLGTLGRRVDFKDAFSQRQAMFEYAPDSVSAQEMLAICEGLDRGSK